MHPLDINSQFCMGTNFGKYMFAKFDPHWGTIFGKGDHFWLPKLVRGTDFGSKNWSGGLVLATFLPKSVQGTNFGDRFWCDSTTTRALKIGIFMSHSGGSGSSLHYRRKIIITHGKDIY